MQNVRHRIGIQGEILEMFQSDDHLLQIRIEKCKEQGHSNLHYDKETDSVSCDWCWRVWLG